MWSTTCTVSSRILRNSLQYTLSTFVCNIRCYCAEKIGRYQNVRTLCEERNHPSCFSYLRLSHEKSALYFLCTLYLFIFILSLYYRNVQKMNARTECPKNCGLNFNDTSDIDFFPTKSSRYFRIVGKELK